MATGPGKFPAAYVESVEKNDSLMEYVDFQKMGIGARTSGLPKGGNVSDMRGLDHVGGTAGGSRTGNNK